MIETRISNDELIFLIYYQNKHRKILRTNLAIYLGVFVLISFIPLNVLPSKRGRIINPNSSQNLLESLGITSWLILVVISVLAYYFFKSRDYKLFGITKDINEQKKIKTRAVIKNSQNEGIVRYFKIDGRKPNSFQYVSRTGKMIYDNTQIEFEYFKNSGLIINVNEE